MEGKFTIGANQYEGTYVLSSLNLYDKYKNTKTYTGEEAAALYKEVTAKNPSYYVPDYDYDYEEEEVVAPTPVPVVRPQTVTPPVQTQEEMSENKAVVLDEAAIAEKAEEAANAKAGETVAVNMRKEDGSLATELPVDILNAVRGKDVNVVLDMGTYSWIINGNDITAENLSAINLEVVLDAVAVPNEIVAQKAGEQPVRQISLTHNGEFGFAAKLSINMGSEYAGEYANLYYYSPAEELEFMNAGLIKEDGNVELAFSHASDYVIVVDEDRTEAETVVVENTEEAEDTETISTESVNVEAEKESGSSGMRVAVIAIIAVIIAAAFVITKKKK